MSPHPTSASSWRTALVVRGGWEAHPPSEGTAVFIPFLEQHGFRVRIEESPEVYADAEYLGMVVLIVQSNTMSTIEPKEFSGLRQAIENGTGLGGWQGGVADTYRNNADYLQLIGASLRRPAGHSSAPAAQRHQIRNHSPHVARLTRRRGPASSFGSESTLWWHSSG
jgi:type 1 glutamine amidotransferase